MIWVLFLATVFYGCSTATLEEKAAVVAEPAPAVQQFQCGWPAFSFAYPGDWKVALQPTQGQVYRVEAPGGLPDATATVNANMTAPVKLFSRSVLPSLSELGSEFDIVHDQAVTLDDGIQGWETLMNWVLKSGKPLSTLFVTVQKDNMWITVSVSADKGAMTEELKQIAYSLKVDPREQPPVEVPADVKQFFTDLSQAIVNHDLEKVLTFYSQK